MFLARQLTESSLNTIGEAFGGRDHGTVLYACRLVKDRMEVDPTFARPFTIWKSNCSVERPPRRVSGFCYRQSPRFCRSVNWLNASH